MMRGITGWIEPCFRAFLGLLLFTGQFNEPSCLLAGAFAFLLGQLFELRHFNLGLFVPAKLAVRASELVVHRVFFWSELHDAWELFDGLFGFPEASESTSIREDSLREVGTQSHRTLQVFRRFARVSTKSDFSRFPKRQGIVRTDVQFPLKLLGGFPELTLLRWYR